MVHKRLKSLMFLMLLLLGVGQTAQATVELTFDEEGKAYIYPTDMKVTGMTLDTETGLLTKTEAGNANILIELGNVDFSDVLRIDVNHDVATSGYTDFFSNTVVRSSTEGDINAWYGSRFGIDYNGDNGSYRARSKNIEAIQMYADESKTGTMKISSICITKKLPGEEIALAEGEVNLKSIPYVFKREIKDDKGEVIETTWALGMPEWNVGYENQYTIYGSGDSNPIRYADLNEYKELRIYQTSGNPVRLFFFNDKSDEYVSGDATGYYETYYAQPVEDTEYSVVDLEAIMEKYGTVKLIGVKAPYNETATVGKLALVKADKPIELTFDEEGKAYIYPKDMIVTGMTLDPITGILEKTDDTKQGNILIKLGDVDFSDVTRIDVNVDTESEGYVDLFATTCVRSIESDINTWYGSRYGIDYTTTYQEKSEHIKEIQMYTVNPSPDLTPADKERLTGSMKINYICITKDVVVASPGDEVNLQTIPYMVKGSDGNWTVGTPDWNVDNGEQETIYGSGDSDPIRYADLAGYNELRIYQTTGDPVRLFFFNDKSDEYAGDETGFYRTYYAQPVEGTDYSVVDLNAIMNEYGFVKLIGIKGNAWGAKATVEKIVAIDSNPKADYVISGKGDVTEGVKTVLHNGDVTVIDARGIVEPMELVSANPNCLFIVNDAAQLTNTKNVVVENEGAYTCAYLVLTPGKPFRTPFEFMAQNASMTKTVAGSGFATLVLPYAVNNVTAGKVYELTNVNGTVVNGDLVTTIEANKPVLLNAGNYELTASNVTIEANPANMTNGALTGVYDATTVIPEGSYVLQNQTNKDGWAFYYVNENSGDDAIKMTPFTAYLNNSGNQANVNMLTFNFNDEVTGIENVEAATSAATVVEIYDLSGRKVSAPVKGINLMKMSDGTVKKVIVK